MDTRSLQKYVAVQNIAKETIQFLKSFIREGVTEREIKEAAEKFMFEKGVHSFWYHDIGTFVFVGERTLLSQSGKIYSPTETKIQKNDLITVDLSPEKDGILGDHARSFLVENGIVVNPEKSTQKEIQEGIGVEEKLHALFRENIRKDISFEEAFLQMNFFIEGFGYTNLDFRNNIGHSIPEEKEKTLFIESGNRTTFREVKLFTFEPHIQKKNGKYGFKREDIYFFKNGILNVL